MENKLTPYLYVADNVVRSTTGSGINPDVIFMDENIDAKEQTQAVVEAKGVEDLQLKKDQEEADERRITVQQLRQEKAKKAWDEVKRKMREKGEKISEEDEDLMRKAIEKGEPPKDIGGGSGDGRFENFPAEKYKGTKLEELAERVRKAGQNSQATPEFLREINKELMELVGSNEITDKEQDQFVKDIFEVGFGGSPNESNQKGPSGDGNLENINLHEYRGTPLEALAEEIAEFGKNPANNKRPVSTEQFNEWVSRARQMLSNGEITQEQFDAFSNEVLGYTRGHNTELQGSGEAGRQERLEETPRSIQEICRWIIDKEGEEWGPGSPNALLDTLEQGAKFNQANFVKWVRERMLHFHNLDPNNPSIDLLNNVGIETTFKRIGVVSMINNKRQYFRDEVSNEVYSDLVEDIVNEVYLFNTSRNHDANYRFTMWNDEKLPELLEQIHQKSDFTNAAQMEKIFSLSADYGSGDTKVGDTIRTIYEAYYFLSDYDELQRVLGKDSVFFTKKGFEDAWRLMSKKTKDDPIAQNYKDFFNEIFDENGKPKPSKFINFVNIFNDTGKNQTDIDLVREALRLAGSQVHGLNNGLDETGDKRNVIRKNLEYAEMWANSMVRWTGAAARNDITAIGYDAFTKAQRFQQYRLRQSKATRGGAFGNEYDLPVIKDMALDFFNGIFVERAVGEKRDFTPFEIFKRLDDIDHRAKRGEITEEQAKTLKDEEFKRFRFKQYTQLDYANNHLHRAYQVFHSLMGANELNFDQIVSFDKFRGLVFDRGKFEEQVKENFIKPIRYAFQTYTNIDYSKKIRTWQGEDENGLPIYEDKTFAEAMFGPMVLQGYYKGKDKNGKPIVDEEKLQSTEGRARLYKNVVRSIIAAHLQSHRRYDSGYAYMNEAQVSKFIKALESIRQMEIEDDGEISKLGRSESFFTREDIAWIRKYSGTQNWKLILVDVIGKEMGSGVLSGFGQGIKGIFDDIIKG